MVAERLRDFEHDALGFQIRFVRVRSGDLEFTDDRANGKIQWLGILVARIALVVIDVKQFVRREARMKSQAQETTFIFVVGFGLAVFDVKKFFRVAAVRTFFDDENFTRLIDDEEALGAIGSLTHPDRTFVLEFGEDVGELDFWKVLRGANRGDRDQSNSDNFLHDAFETHPNCRWFRWKCFLPARANRLGKRACSTTILFPVQKIRPAVH